MAFWWLAAEHPHGPGLCHYSIANIIISCEIETMSSASRTILLSRLEHETRLLIFLLCLILGFDDKFTCENLARGYMALMPPL